MADQLPAIRVLDFRTSTRPDGTAYDEVLYAPAHAVQTTQIWARVDTLKPPPGGGLVDHDETGQKTGAMRDRWALFEPAYKAWKEGNEIPLNGTPLSAWAGLTRDHVKVLQQAGVRTVEEVAALPDGGRGIRLPDMPAIQRQAVAFLDAKDQSAASDRISTLEAMLEELAEQNRALSERLEGRQATSAEEQEDGLRRQLDELGVEYDGRWGVEKLQAALDEATKPAKARK